MSREIRACLLLGAALTSGWAISLAAPVAAASRVTYIGAVAGPAASQWNEDQARKIRAYAAAKNLMNVKAAMDGSTYQYALGQCVSHGTFTYMWNTGDTSHHQPMRAMPTP